MRYVFILIAVWSVTGVVRGQSVEEMQQQLNAAGTTQEKLELNYQIAETMMRTDPGAAVSYARAAHKLAQELASDAMLARTAFLTAQVYERDRDERNQEVWLKSTLAYAKKAGDSDLVVRSVDKRSSLWRSKRNYRRAYEINKEAFEYFSNSGTSISELESQYQRQRADLERQKENLEQERQLLQAEIDRLLGEREQLSSEKNALQAQQEQLVTAKQQVEQEISKKEEALIDIARQKERAEELAEERSETVRLLSRDTLEKRYLLEEARAGLAEEKLKLVERTNFLRISGISAGSLLLISLLMYGRFRAKKRSARQLASKNEIIEQERKRSDDLLLNILPAAIAAELKEKNKAQARRFEEVTVLFSDFHNFTSISEQLGPEELVEELDKCFKAFDHIVDQFEDVEKIKTIGDAYMCACGLSDQASVPNNMVRAALHMQAYLNEYKAVRQRQGKPYFEARIGLHTGPVIAGVVGTRKFAYDIWGDTVNIAARIESQSEPGRINISEYTFQKVRYQFECSPRGRIYAKNKGDIPMYFVERESTAVKPSYG